MHDPTAGDFLPLAHYNVSNVCTSVGVLGRDDAEPAAAKRLYVTVYDAASRRRAAWCTSAATFGEPTRANLGDWEGSTLVKNASNVRAVIEMPCNVSASSCRQVLSACRALDEGALY